MTQPVATTTTSKLYGKVTEDNAGGLTLWVIDATTDIPVWAHGGYEYDRMPGRLGRDIRALIVHDSVRGWDGDQLTEWCEQTLISPSDLWFARSCDEALIAEIEGGILYVYAHRMGAAGCREFLASTDDKYRFPAEMSGASIEDIHTAMIASGSVK